MCENNTDGCENCSCKAKQSQVETYTVMVLSTAHLTPQDTEVLSEQAKNPDEWMIMEREPGFFIKLYAFADHEGDNRFSHSETLKNIIRYALANGHQMIEFDRDAVEMVDLFPVFDV